MHKQRRKIMKLQHLIIALISVLYLTSCGNSEVIITEDEIAEDLFYLGNQFKPYTGKCIIHFQGTETVKEVMYYKKGLLHGERISYFKNGKVKLEGYYNEGMYNGVWKSYHTCGSVIYQATYKNDTLELLHASDSPNSEHTITYESEENLLALK